MSRDPAPEAPDASAGVIVESVDVGLSEEARMEFAHVAVPERTRPPGDRPSPGDLSTRKTSDGRDREFVVLVVEDEPETLEAVAELLESEDVAVLRARHGREALDLLEGGARPSLILLDLRMPVMDGWEFCRRITADPDLARIPVAVVTASASVQPPPRPNDAGLFVKPVDYGRLLAMVERFRR